MTFKSTHQGVLCVAKNTSCEALVTSFLMNLEKPEEVQKHYEQLITNLHLVFPFLT